MHHYVLIRLLIKGSFVIPVMGMLCQVVAKAQTSIDAAPRLNEGGSVRQLERSWDQLNQQLNSLDTLLGPAPALEASDDLRSPELPRRLLRANEPASGSLSDDQSLPDAPLQLPNAQEAIAGRIRAVSLEQAIAIAFRNNPNLEIQRNQIAAQAATVASLSGAYWPTISVFADVEGFQSGSSTYSPYGNNNYGFGPMFVAQGQGENVALTKNGNSVSNPSAGPFYVPCLLYTSPSPRDCQ